MELQGRHQRALLWAFNGYGTDGRALRESASEELGVRWNDRKSNALDPNGTKISLDADIVTDQELVIGSVLWPGSINDLADLVSGTGSGTDLEPPDDLTPIYRVVTTTKMKDIRGRSTRFEHGLKRLYDGLPPTS